MSENIENLKSVLKIRILTWIPPKQPFRWTISRNAIKKSSSALHFEKFGKVRKFDNNTFFYSRNCCSFNNFQGSSISAKKLLLTWCCTCIYQLPKVLILHKNVSQNNFCKYSFGLSLFAPSLSAVLAVEITLNFNCKLSQKVDSGMSQI